MVSATARMVMSEARAAQRSVRDYPHISDDVGGANGGLISASARAVLAA